MKLLIKNVLKSYVTSTFSVPLRNALDVSINNSHDIKSLNGSQMCKDAVEQRKQARNLSVHLH
jgi:hypothetical protein